MVKKLNLFNFFIFFIFFIILFNVFNYQSNLIASNYFVEPAENESLVFINSDSFKLRSSNIDEYIREGLLPIYPDFYYRVAEFFKGNDLYKLRLTNILAFWFLTFLTFLISFRKTKDFGISLLLAVSIYGTAQHSLYFYMGRPDGLFVVFGFLSTLLLISFTNKKEETLNTSKAIIILVSALLSSLSILIKQSALVFPVINILFLSYKYFHDRNFVNLINIFSYSIFSFSFTVIYYYFNPVAFEFFLNGLNLYGSEFSLGHVYLQTKDLFYFYWWQILLIFLIFLKLFNDKDNKTLIFWSLLWTLIMGFTVKMFSNSAANYNNYILVNIFFVTMIIILFKKIKRNELFKVITLLGVIGFHFNFSIIEQIPFIKISNTHAEYTKKINMNIDFKSSEIFKYLNNNPGQYLTGRNDNFLYFSENKISYEASVLDNFFLETNEASPIKLKNSMNEKFNEVHKKINNKEYDGIILGIGNKTLRNFPDINEYYKLRFSQEVSAGDWPHTISLYTPK